VGQGLYVVYVAVEVTRVVLEVVIIGQHGRVVVVHTGEHMAASLSARLTAVTGTGPMVYVTQGRVRVTVVEVFVVYVTVGWAKH
jgi:hypothetical protein